MDRPVPCARPKGLLTGIPLTGPFTCQCEHTEAVQSWLKENSSDEDESLSPRPLDGTKLKGYDLYNALGRPKHIVAPMVDQSELSFRLLCKRYGADLCYSPMINSACFTRDPGGVYRFREFSTCPADTNMIVQFCGHDPETLVEAGKIVENSGCAAIDLNLGCPQGIARKGYYGAFLMDDLSLIRTLVTSMDQHLAVPVTVKIRMFKDVQHTIAYAKMLQEAGAAMLGMHGRVREAKGAVPGKADWEQIRMVKEALDIPVFANGNIWWHGDIDECLKATGCDAVMSADTLLWEPRTFARPAEFLVSGRHFNVKDPAVRLQGCRTAQEYLDICATHPTQNGHMKAHLFKMTHHSLTTHPEMRQRLTEILPETHGANLLPVFQAFINDLVKIEEGLCNGHQQRRTPTTEEHCRVVEQLGNVVIPDECLLSRLTEPADLESDYRKKKDERLARLEEDDPGEFTLFD